MSATRITVFQEFPEPPRDQRVMHTTRAGKGCVARLAVKPASAKQRRKPRPKPAR